MGKDGKLRIVSPSYRREKNIDLANWDRNKNNGRRQFTGIHFDSRSSSPPRSRSPHRSKSRSPEKGVDNIKYRLEKRRYMNKDSSRNEKFKLKEDSLLMDSRYNWTERQCDRGGFKEKVSENRDNDHWNVMTEYGFDNQLGTVMFPNKLEAEMQKRRERIALWRATYRKTHLSDVLIKTELSSDCNDGSHKEENCGQHTETDKILPNIDEKFSSDLANAQPIDLTNSVIGQDLVGIEEDPLDIFMVSVKEELREDNNGEENKLYPKGSLQKVPSLVLNGLEKMSKGEILEQHLDQPEYSSEEENEDFETKFNNIIMSSSKRKKDLAKVDHTAIQYPSFRKNFYVEVPELARMTLEVVEGYRCDLEGIRVKGKGCPKPIKTWAQAGVSKREMDVLKKLGFEKPTPIQCQAIPAIMSGRDLIGISKTGSGKTLAFLLPMFRHVLDQPCLEKGDGPISVIMTPTRELCMQIAKETKRFCKYLSLRVACVYGGSGVSEQISELKRGAEIIVCTPGRMIDMLTVNSGRVTNLRRCTYIVLDEADRMFDMGFEPQVMRVVHNIRPDRQTVLFSATFPRQMEALARKILNGPIEIQVGGRSIVCKEVEQNVIVLEEQTKFFKLLELLGIYQEQGSVIVFVDKQESADLLLKNLMKAGYPCLSLHGGIDQCDRDSTITDFKSGKSKLLVATSVAARGLDIKQLVLVVNYDCPNHYEDYVHRCGRTGRAGNKGFAYTFVTPEQERYAGDIVKALKLSGGHIPEELTQIWNSYQGKQKYQVKKIKSGKGFSGKGYKFDDAETQLSNDKKKFHQSTLGLQVSDDEEIEDDIQQQIEKLMSPEIEPEIISVAPPKLRSGIEKDLRVTSNDPQKGDISTQQWITAKIVAERIAAKLTRKINCQSSEKRTDLSNESMISINPSVQKVYNEELVINDFPQQVRCRITSKGTLAQISDYSEAGISVRGTFIAPGKNVTEGGRRLYLAIESISEFAVRNAKNEICRILKDEYMKMQTFHPIKRGSKAHYVL